MIAFHILNYSEKKERFFSRKPVETESLAEVQFLIDICRLVSQSNYLNSNKDYDWLILACFIREQSTVDAIFTPLEYKAWFEQKKCKFVMNLLHSLS